MALKTHLKIAGRRGDDWAALTPVYCGQSPPDGFSYFVGQGKITCKECKKHEPEAARHELQKRRARKMARRVTLASLGKRKPDARVTELAETDAVLLTIPWAPARGSRARFSVDVVAEKDDPLGGWKWAPDPGTLSVLAPEQCAVDEERRRILTRKRPPTTREEKRLAEIARIVRTKPGTMGKCDAVRCGKKPDVSFLTTNADVWFCRRHARELGEALVKAST